MNEQSAKMLYNLAQRVIFLENVTSFLMWAVLFIIVVGGFIMFKNFVTNIVKSVTGK